MQRLTHSIKIGDFTSTCLRVFHLPTRTKAIKPKVLIRIAASKRWSFFQEGIVTHADTKECSYNVRFLGICQNPQNNQVNK